MTIEPIGPEVFRVDGVVVKNSEIITVCGYDGDHVARRLIVHKAMPEGVLGVDEDRNAWRKYLYHKMGAIMGVKK